MTASEDRGDDPSLLPGPDQRSATVDERVQALVRQLAEVEAALRSVTGGVDSVLDPETATPLLLRQAQRDLAEAEERYDRLVARLSAVVFELTPTGELVFVNHAVEPILGYNVVELQGTRWWEKLLPGELAGQRPVLGRVLIRGDVTGYEMVVAAKNGSRRTLSLNTANRYDATGRLERVVAIATDITESKEAEALRRGYTRRLVEAVENERRMIARELHDEAGQSLAALTLAIGHLIHQFAGHGYDTAGLADLQRAVDGIMHDLHRLAANLRPASLDRYGLVPALEQLIDDFRQRTGLLVEFATSNVNGVRYTTEVENNVYRLVQEALTNVARHAHATRVDVVLLRRNNSLVATIEDDGQGFHVTQALRSGRLGLLGMQERTSILGGTFTVESKPQSGTSIFVEVPIDDHAAG